MPDPSTLAGFITYLLYLIPIGVAILIGWVQLTIQVKVQRNIYRAQRYNPIRFELMSLLQQYMELNSLGGESDDIGTLDKRDIYVEKLLRLHSKLSEYFELASITIHENFRGDFKKRRVEFSLYHTQLINMIWRGNIENGHQTKLYHKARRLKKILIQSE